MDTETNTHDKNGNVANATADKIEDVATTAATSFDKHRANLSRTIDEKQKDLFSKVDAAKNGIENAFNVQKIMHENPVAAVSVVAGLGFLTSRLLFARRAPNGLTGFIINKVSGLAFGAIAGYALREVRKIVAAQAGRHSNSALPPVNPGLARPTPHFNSGYTTEMAHRLGSSSTDANKDAD